MGNLNYSSLLLATSILILLVQVNSLTESEEKRLILTQDISIIDEKLRELPGGILIPPEPESLPMPTMDISLDKINHPQINKHKSSVRIIPQGIERVREAVKTMQDRLKSTSSIHRRLYNPSSRQFSYSKTSMVSNPASLLEIGLKRIEILSSRAGFNLSSVPRRTQLQIVTRLADKLPVKYSSVILKSLKSNDEKIFEFLPEPIRDPLIEDKPEFLSHFLVESDEAEAFRDDDENVNPSSRIDTSKVSLTNDASYPPTLLDHFDNHEEHRVSNIHSYGPGQSSSLSLSIALPPLPSESDPEPPTKLPTPSMLVQENWTKPKRVVITTTEPTTTSTSTTTTTEKPILRNAKSLEAKHKPIRVSIISKDNFVQSSVAETIAREEQFEEDQRATASQSEKQPDLTSSSSEKIEIVPTEIIPVKIDKTKSHLKYVNVEPISKKNRTNLLFELESEIDSDYDLSEDEIAAMVQELKRYEEEETGNKFENSVEFDYSRLLTPHPLEYPDHPDHPKSDFNDEIIEELIKSQPTVSTTVGSPTSSPSNRIQFPNHFQRFQNHPFHKLPPLIQNRLRPRLPPSHPFNQPHPQYNRPRPHPQLQQPIRINDVKVSEIPKSFNKECDYFSNELCLLVQDYPIEAISSAIESNPELSLNLLPREESKSEEKPEKLSSEGGFLCPSKVAYGKIKKAKSSSNSKWKFIVNYGDKTQTLRLEKCLTPGDRCSYVMPHYRTACTQVYNYHRLLAWDSEQGLHIDLFKVPTCCTCHVQGYYQKNNFPQSPKRRMMLVNNNQGPYQGQQPHPQMNMPPPMYSQHPMNRFARNRFVNRPHFNNPVAMVTSANSNPEKIAEKEDDLQELLKQYSNLRDKISKKKSATTPTAATPTTVTKTTSTRSDRMLKNLNLLESALLRKRKRSNTNVGKTQKLTDLKKLLRNLQLKKLAKNTKKNTRQSRQMRVEKLKKKLKQKRIQFLVKKINKHKLNKASRVNYQYHPIMDYYNKAKKN